MTVQVGSVSTIGLGVRRGGGRERVTGAQQFLADIHLAGTLQVKLVTLDCARARIIAIDTSAARQIPGVRCILTAEELPGPMPRFGPAYEDRPVLAVGETKYHGEPVAAVAAETLDAATAAAAAVRVEYEPLVTVSTLDEALDPSAPLVQDPALRAGDPLRHTNVLKERRYAWGDVLASSADLIIDETYTFPMVTHFAIEPHGFMAAPDSDGISIWSAVQHPYLLQRVMSQILNMPLSKVRVFAPDPGGAFGGKQNPKFEPLVAFLALRTGAPCRLVLTLEETFQAVRRSATKIHARTGFTSDGIIAFQDIHADYLLGAYVDVAERVMTKSSYLACGPYRVPAARIVARAVLSHTTPSTAFRGFGTPQVSWAIESQMDKAASELSIDRVQIRLRNLASRGEAIVPNDTPADGDWALSVQEAARLVDWGAPLPPGHGRGLAVGIKASATTGLSYSTVRLLFDGSVVVYAGTSDMGQGARTIFAQIAAKELATTPDRVAVIMGDTAIVPFDLQTSASRSTVFMGNAILDACSHIHAQLREIAAQRFGTTCSQVTLQDGVLQASRDEITIVELMRSHLGRLRGELIGNGSMRKEDMADHPLGGSPAFYEFNCSAFEVSVDTETGDVLVIKQVTVGDAGTILNSLQAQAQDEGAAVMGLGHTIMEQVILDESGRIANLGALDYRIVTTKDLPLSLRAVNIEQHDGPGPYGAKGISEGGLLCTAPAFASAVSEAAGIFICDLPLTPERIWTAVQQAHREAEGTAV